MREFNWNRFYGEKRHGLLEAVKPILVHHRHGLHEIVNRRRDRLKEELKSGVNILYFVVDKKGGI